MVPAAVALGLAALAWLVIRRLYLAVAFGLLALALASSALLMSGLVAASTSAVVLATTAPGLWLAGRATRPKWRLLSVGVALGVASTWLVSCFIWIDAFDAAEWARRIYLAVSLLTVVIVAGDWRRWRVRIVTLDPGRLTDLFAIASVVAVLVMVAVATEMPFVLLATAVGGLALLYPTIRRRLVKTLDELVFGDYRGRASLAAVEAERGRIARDLHDAPLQEIAAVIRELDSRGDASPQVDVLRRAAGNLRRVTTELRPPVLDDLGLPAAIAYVAQTAAARCPTISVSSSIDPSEPLAERAPVDVELGVFRIVQEAVENAIRHSRASAIHIDALVRATEVVATISDDGIGISKGAERKALRDGHVGLSNMAQRAALIHAELHVGRAHPRGTTVRVVWRPST
jgi:signal transduction histidine kinase